MSLAEGVLQIIEDAADLTTGYALVNGRRAVYILATKRADASTISVIDARSHAGACRDAPTTGGR